jgi:hypothetical protein
MSDRISEDPHTADIIAEHEGIKLDALTGIRRAQKD